MNTSRNRVKLLKVGIKLKIRVIYLLKNREIDSKTALDKKNLGGFSLDFCNVLLLRIP